MFFTYEQNKWQSLEGKKDGEKWISIFVNYEAIPFFTQDQINKIVVGLKDAGYTALLGRFGVGGPYIAGMGYLVNSQTSTVFYFNKKSEQIAADARSIISKVLPTTDLKVEFADPSKMTAGNAIRFVAENSGLDAQLVLNSP